MTLAEKKNKIKELIRKSKNYRNVCFEGAEGPTPFDGELEALSKQIAIELKAANHAEWSKDVTIARRDTWNLEIRAIDRQNSWISYQSQFELTLHARLFQFSLAIIKDIETRLGFTMFDLRNAVKRHNL